MLGTEHYFAVSPSQGTETLVADRYRLGMLLGQGSMGTVHLATDMKSGSTVALKRLSPEIARHVNADQLRERFRREALVLANLSHPNTVRLIDYGELGNDEYYLAMEYIRGTTLLDLLDEEGALESSVIVDLAIQLCASVGEAHEAGVIHRDLKPDNIMLQKDISRFCGYGLKLCDFGVAQLGPELVREKLTEAGMTVGTVLYMAPEQAQGLTLSPATDVYAIGCLLHEMLTGEPPFIGNMVQITSGHARRPPPRLEVPGMPRKERDQWQRVIDRAMAKRPESRPSSAHELALMVRDVGASPLKGSLGLTSASSSEAGAKDAPKSSLVGVMTSAPTRNWLKAGLGALGLGRGRA